MNNLPSGFPTSATEYLLDVSAIDTPEVSDFSVVNIGGSSSSDPTVLKNLNEHTHLGVGASTQEVEWDIANFHRMEIMGDIDIAFIDLPGSGKWEPLILQITQDVIGGRTVTFPVSLS